jgi:RNA recognition motif-containing protein
MLTMVDEDLELIFSRFGKILSCEVIRDKRTGDSLQYAFIEFDNQKDCEQAYFKMQGVLIDDHRIHVDFSQSVSSISYSILLSCNANHLHRCQSCPTAGVMPLFPSEVHRGVALVVWPVWRRSASTERLKILVKKVITTWFSTKRRGRDDQRLASGQIVEAHN